MAVLLKGAEVAAAINERLSARVAALESNSIKPTLAIVRVTDSPESAAYENGVINRCDAVGIATRHINLPEDCGHDELARIVDELNDDESVHGVLLARPLPEGADVEALRSLLSPAKDVDGFTSASLASVFTGMGEGYPPCAALACIEILDHYGVEIDGRRVVIVGRSIAAGKPAAMLFLNRNATVTICHTRTSGLEDICRAADIVVAAAGCAGMIGAEHIAPGQTVLDIGMNITDEGIIGDVRDGESDETAAARAPVPGGVSAVIPSVLASHVIDAAEKFYREKLNEATIRG